MRTDNKNLGTDTGNNDLTIVIKTDGKVKTPVIITLLPLLSMLVAILPDVILGNTGLNTAKLGIITLILTAVITFYIRLNADSLLDKKLAKTIILSGYLVSICLLLILPEPEVYNFWMLGGLLTAMLVDNKLGLLMHFNMSFIMGITLSFHPETVIQILILGVLMSLLAGALRQKSTMIYASIIILSTNITLAFAINNFIFETESNYNYFSSLFSILVVLVTAFFISMLYELKYPKEALISEQPESGQPEFEQPESDQKMPENHVSITQVSQNSIAEEAVIIKESLLAPEVSTETVENTIPVVSDIVVTSLTSATQQDFNTWTSYDVLCDLDNELIKRMREFSESLYTHSVYIGDLSSRAAQEIGANEQLAMAGGFYHEIGKIKGKNYIEEGLNLAEEYSFPKELKAILKEHNIKHEKPSSVEAAIVMLSDNVVSTIEYIEKTEEHKYTTDKIIDNIFIMRMDKGTFDSSTLSLKDFKKLKEFYQKEFRKQ